MQQQQQQQQQQQEEEEEEARKAREIEADAHQTGVGGVSAHFQDPNNTFSGFSHRHSVFQQKNEK
jgi:hypothetical protein